MSTADWLAAWMNECWKGWKKLWDQRRLAANIGRYVKFACVVCAVQRSVFFVVEELNEFLSQGQFDERLICIYYVFAAIVLGAKYDM